MKKTTIILLILIVLGILYVLYNNPLVINKNQAELIIVGDTLQPNFNPIQRIDLSTGCNVAYLLIGRADISKLPKEMDKHKIFECRNNRLLNKLKENFVFTQTNGDMATCESEIFIYNNRKLVLHTSFLFNEKNFGIQNSLTGWSEAVNYEELKNIFLQFETVNSPIVILE